MDSVGGLLLLVEANGEGLYPGGEEDFAHFEAILGALVDDDHVPAGGGQFVIPGKDHDTRIGGDLDRPRDVGSQLGGEVRGFDELLQVIPDFHGIEAAFDDGF